MKVALVACGRLENRYAVEWVEHYKQLGFDHIYIADNNREGEEYFGDVLQSYIDDQFVTIYDYRHVHPVQFLCYYEIYYKISDDYDWIAFLDFDEFLFLTEDPNIKDYLSRDCFKNANQILINWKTYTDNDLIYDDGRPCLERFTEISDRLYIKYKEFNENSHVKCIIKTKLNNININAHFSMNFLLIKSTYTNNGIKCHCDYFQPINYDLAYIKHFPTKTIEEFINTKFIRGVCDGNPKFKNYPLEWFFKYNNITDEKLNYLKSINIDVSNINKNYINNWWPYS